MGKVGIKGFRSDLQKVPTKVYDVEKKELIGFFDTRKEAAEFLGTNTGAVASAFKRKARMFSKKLGLTVCIR